jgi:hypothetical protein
MFLSHKFSELGFYIHIKVVVGRRNATLCSVIRGSDWLDHRPTEDSRRNLRNDMVSNKLDYLYMRGFSIARNL